MLSSIGIVDEADIGITYIPVARSYRGNDVYKPHDKDDVTELLFIFVLLRLFQRLILICL